MGFATSGAVAIIFVGALVAFGVLYPTMQATRERVSEAEDRRAEAALARENTDISVSVSYNASINTLVVNVTNKGSTTLSVERTDVLVDGRYETVDSTTVGGESRTIWVPGERLRIETTEAARPDRVKVVVEYGVAETVTGV